MSLSNLRKFLQLIAIAHIAGGILLPFLVNTQLFSTYNTIVHQALGLETTGKTIEINFLIGLFGPTIASWGVLFLYVVTTAFRNPDRRGWWTIFACCILWAPYDSILSIQREIYVNAFINLVSALTILIPLFMAKKYFFQASNSQLHG
jgi:hypothetical protein